MRIVCTLVALFLTVPGVAAAQQPDSGTQSVVVTTGEAVVNAAPDRAWIAITAESRAGNPREAQRRNAEAMSAVLDKLKGAGLQDEAIRTAGYDLQQEFDFVDGRRVSRGYVARNTVEVRVDEIDRVGQLLEIAVGSGATSVGGLRFDLKDRGKLEREAIRLATQDAQLRADAAAAAAGRAIERVIRIEATTPGDMPVRPFAMAREALQDASAAPPIAAGQIEVRAQVTLTSSLK